MAILTREQERIRWRSRRGLLEMDLILNRFLEQHLTHLTEGEIKSFDALLQLPDNDLLDLAMARKEPEDASVVSLLEKIRKS
jgi:antitoxin CptB